MPDTVSVETQGTKLQIGDGGSPESFNAIAQITGIPGAPGYSRGTKDVTTLDSVMREYKTILADGKEVTFDLILDTSNTQHQALRDDDGKKKNFKVVMADAAVTTISFAALITDYSPSAEIDSVWEVSVTLKPTGAITYS